MLPCTHTHSNNAVDKWECKKKKKLAGKSRILKQKKQDDKVSWSPVTESLTIGSKEEKNGILTHKRQ